MPEEKLINRDDLIGVLTLAILFISVVGGREVGNYYASYQEMTKLKVLFEVTEEELSRYIVELSQGQDSDLEVGITISGSEADNPAGLVTDTPDYVKRWLIGLTVSPVVVNQPEASDVELEMLIEGTPVDEALYSFPKQKISYIQFTDRRIRLEIDDVDEFKRIVEEASKEHGGEIKVTFRGSVHMYLLFLDTWLPFSVTRYPIVEAPHLGYVESGWKSYTQGAVSSLEVGEGGYVLVEFKNPTRLHSLREDVTCLIYRVGEDESVLSVSKNVQVPPDTNGQYTFSFTLTEPGDYVYRILSGDRVLTDNSTILSVK